jgi:site-specific DNA recombinase
MAFDEYLSLHVAPNSSTLSGVPPLGYRAEDHKLVIIDREAEIVRAMFRRYVELGSVRLLKEELEARGIKSKSWTNASVHLIGGKPFSGGALYLILRNRTYLGAIVHKGQSHPGEHPPIIDQVLWDTVQAQLTGNTAQRNSGTRIRHPSLLTGMLFDCSGNPMTPTHAVKKGTRYRYYVSRPLITKDQTESVGLRLPSAQIEQLVTSRIRQWLLDPGGIYNATRLADPAVQRRLVTRAAEFAKSWPELPATRQRAFLATLIERIDVGVDRIDIRLSPTRLGTLLEVAAMILPSAIDDGARILSVPMRLCRSGREIGMLIDGTDPFTPTKPDPRLIKLLIRARRFNAALAGSDGVPFAGLAKRQGVSPSYFTRILRLSYLAPDITEAILDGRQPRDLTADKLLAHSRLPLVWQDQRALLGFA